MHKKVYIVEEGYGKEKTFLSLCLSSLFPLTSEALRKTNSHLNVIAW